MAAEPTTIEEQEVRLAPAICRAFEILKLLNSTGELPLYEIAVRTNIPKASARRFLQTLVYEGVVAVNPQTGSYSATHVLVPLGTDDAGFEKEVETALSRLSDLSGQTAEWWVQSVAGAVLVKRSEPVGQEVRVCAQIGFLRTWEGELEAVNRVMQGALPQMEFARDTDWLYCRDAIRCTLTTSQANDLVAEAQALGYAVDELINGNGVRRLAYAVRRNGALVGVLALAQYIPATGERGHDLLLSQLQQEGAKLCRD